MIAALFVEEGGVYYNLPNVDPWPESRDARKYAGPHRVIAHPPCQLWVNFAALNFKRYGGEHNRPGNDGGCFESALRAVVCFGGILEQPAGSKAWKFYGLVTPGPIGFGWLYVGVQPNGKKQYVCEVWQSAYGHKARKRTWLLYVGEDFPPELDWSRKPGTHQCGWFDRIKPTLGKRDASRTPIPFRDLLISMVSP